MKKHFQYLSYVLRHKWFVFQACHKREIFVQGILHDWSKFLPDEWFPYAEYFYGTKKEDPWTNQLGLQTKFDGAWLKHQHRSPHHWQHYILREDSGETKFLPIPERLVLEMVSDWEGAGRAITGKTGTTPSWYVTNKEKFQLHPDTRERVEELLGLRNPENIRNSEAVKPL